MSERLVLGVDGGNTKTVALVARADGTIVGGGRAGCADIYGVAPEAAVAEVVHAVEQALAQARIPPGELAACVFSLAGADWPEDVEFLRRELGRRLPVAMPPFVVNDAIGALRAGTPDGVGVAVVCGTGGCIGARAPEGRTWHSGFWAYQTGGWAMGQQALEAIYQAELGIGPTTTLASRALTAFGEPSVEALLHAFTRRGGRGPFEAAELAPAVLDEAETGDAVARLIVEQQGTLLGGLARVGAERVGLVGKPFPLVLLGGVFRHRSRTLPEAVQAHVPEAQLVERAPEPAIGAVLLALDAAGATPDERRLRETLPNPELFAT